MKILLVNVVCTGGSTGKITSNLYSEYKKSGHEVRVCYGRGSAPNPTDFYKISTQIQTNLHGILTRFIGYVGSGNHPATKKLIEYIMDFSPDVVHLHNLHGYYIDAYLLLSYLKTSGIKTLITMHDEWFFTGKCTHPYGCEKWQSECKKCPQKREYPKSLFFGRSRIEFSHKKEIFYNWENIVITPVANWLRVRAEQSAIMGQLQIREVNNGIDLAVFHPSNTHEIIQKHSLKKEKILLHVTPNFHDKRKGGNFVLDIAVRLANENVKIIIVGITKPIDNCPNNVITVKHTHNQYELVQYYSLADALIVVSEMESLPTVCIESICCGTPVLGFYCEGAEEVAHPGYGRFCKYGDIDALELLVREFVSEEIMLKTGEECAEYGRQSFDKAQMSEKYLKLYQN